MQLCSGYAKGGHAQIVFDGNYDECPCCSLAAKVHDLEEEVMALRAKVIKEEREEDPNATE